MEVITCRKCRKMFNYIGGDRYCPSCREAAEEEFQKVKEYVRNNKGATVVQVAKECEVTEKQIREWIRQERLELAGTDAGVFCEKCGVAISSGRYCDACKADMTNALKSTMQSMRPKEEAKKPQNIDHGNKMRFLQK